MTLRDRARRLHRFLLGFFAAPTSGASAALFRIVFGLLSTWTAIGVGLNLDRYWSGDGALPWAAMRHSANAHWSLVAIAPGDDRLLVGIFVLLLGASIALTVGFFSRASAAVIFIVHVSLQNRNPYTVNGGDRLFVILALLAVLMPLARRWSVQAWWRARWGKPLAGEPTWWALRLAQLQVAYLYLSTGLVKAEHVRWWSGRAMGDVLASPVYCEWPTHLSFWPLVAFLTYFTLLFEVFAFPMLIWFQKTRRFVLWWGILFHIGIEVLMVIPMFSVIMVVTYTLFLTDEESERIVAALTRSFRPARPGSADVARGPSPAAAS